MNKIKDIWKGFTLCLAISIPCWYLGNLFPIVGGPVFGILSGMLITLFLNKKSSLQPGITFTSKKILQYAVVLLGFGLNLSVVLETGRQSLPIILSTISTSLILAFALHAPDRKRATKIRIFVHCYFSLLYIFVTIIVKILTICQRIRYGILL